MEMRTIFNDFYTGRILPHAVVALDSPRFGVFEQQLLRKFFSPPSPSSPPPSCSSIFRRPIFVCADGAFRKVMQFAPETRASVDFVVGDLDSLKPPPEWIAAQVETVNDFNVPRSREELDALRAAARSMVQKKLENNQQNASSSDLHVIPYVLKVREQNSTDFEKALTLCSRLFTASATASNSNSSYAPSVRHSVLTVGGHGGEWHHQAGVLHTAAKSAGDAVLDVRVLSPTSTIMFCRPTGKTIFRRNAEFESDVFAVVPLGTPPKSIVTTGLKWNLDTKNDAEQRKNFGWASCSPAFISTSNRFADVTDPLATEQVVEIDIEDEGRGAVVAISVNNKSAVVSDQPAVSKL